MFNRRGLFIMNPTLPIPTNHFLLMFYTEHTNMLIFFYVSLVIVLLLLILSYSLSSNNPAPEKQTAYECGFEPFDDGKKSFDIQFYIIGVLFLIFDLEVVFLFPWALSLSHIGIFGF
jgi:NADH:ubiquinone oxidoreductase subunit 3 (subunit A)